jgi:hypothetical protein
MRNSKLKPKATLTTGTIKEKSFGDKLVRKTKIESPRMETKPLNSMKVSSNTDDIKKAIDAASKVAKYSKFK